MLKRLLADPDYELRTSSAVSLILLGNNDGQAIVLEELRSINADQTQFALHELDILNATQSGFARNEVLIINNRSR